MSGRSRFGTAACHVERIQFVDTYGVQPPIGGRFRFEDAIVAYRAQASPESFGKIVNDAT